MLRKHNKQGFTTRYDIRGKEPQNYHKYAETTVYREREQTCTARALQAQERITWV
jgi:hypothetical protein